LPDPALKPYFSAAPLNQNLRRIDPAVGDFFVFGPPFIPPRLPRPGCRSYGISERRPLCKKTTSQFAWIVVFAGKTLIFLPTRHVAGESRNFLKCT